MPQTGHNGAKSTATSWLAVLGLGLLIFAVLWGVAQLFGGVDTDVDYEWQDQAPWVLLAVVLLLLLIVLLGWTIGRDRSRNPQRVRKRALVLGSWAVYLPSLGGSLPAIMGLVYDMVTPFLGGGLIAIMAAMLAESGMTHDVGDWIARGIVSPEWAWYEESQTRSTIAQAIAAAGLAATVIGFIQVYRAHRDKRLQTKGLYATVRHPQHLGIALWTFGLAFAVSGTAGYMMWFTVLYFYVLLAVREERQLARQFGSAYEPYRRATPFMIPFVNTGLPLPGSGGLRTAALVAYYIAGLTVLCLILQGIGVEDGFL